MVVGPPVFDVEAPVEVGEGDPGELYAEVGTNMLHPPLQGIEAPFGKMVADVVLVTKELHTSPSLHKIIQNLQVALLTFLALPHGSSGGLKR